MKFTLEQQIAVDLWLLDTLLTGKDARNYKGGPDSIGVELEGFIEGGREFYLSDGGYSRVCYSYVTKLLFLTSNSRDDVRARWGAASSITDRIERNIRALLKEHGVE